jgi:hypothetical protein
MVIGASRREQSLALNSEKRALKGAVRGVSREGLALAERRALDIRSIIWYWKKRETC